MRASTMDSDDCNNASTRDIGRQGREGGRALVPIPQNGTFSWLSSTSTLTRVYHNRSITLQKDIGVFSCSAPFLHPRPTSLMHTIHEYTSLVSRTLMCFRDRRLSCTTPTTTTHPLVGFRFQRLLHIFMCGVIKPLVLYNLDHYNITNLDYSCHHQLLIPVETCLMTLCCVLADPACEFWNWFRKKQERV